MDFDYAKILKAFGDEEYKFASNLTRKIVGVPTPATHLSFCGWSDLLGFGDVFFDSNWHPSKKQIRNIYKRLQLAHNIFLYHMDTSARAIMLNDGFAKVFPFADAPGFLFSLSLFFVRLCGRIYR